METSTVARSYAESAFELAQKRNLQDEFGAGFDALDVVLSEPVARTFLESPRVDTTNKKRVLRAALGAHVDALFMNFVLLVLDKRRQRLYSAIANEYRALVEGAAGRLHVNVTLARRPTPEMEEDIRRRLSEIFGKTVIPHVAIDEKILGGIVVRQGDAIIDGSLRRQLLGMRRRLLNTNV